MSLASLIVRIGADLGDYDRKLAAAERRIGEFGSKLSNVGNSLTLGLSLPLAAFGGVALKAAADIEALKMGLTAVTGSAAETERQFQDLKEVAKLPGLGLTEALRGATNLQAIGFSASKSKDILLQFGNALASVGRGREDLEEVTRQLGQMASRGKVTADNLKPIIERVPQVASIIRREFGSIDTEVLQKMGISAEKMTDTLLTELGKLPRVSGGLKNDFENLKDSMTLAFAEAGAAIAPFAKAFIDDFAVPAIGHLKSLAEGFRDLPRPVQDATVAFGGLLLLGPGLLSLLGNMITNIATISGAINKLGGALAVLKIGAWATGLASVAFSIYEVAKATTWMDKGNKAAADANKSLTATLDDLHQRLVNIGQGKAAWSLREQFYAGSLTAEQYSKSLLGLAQRFAPVVEAAKKTSPPIIASKEAMEKAAAEAKKLEHNYKLAVDQLARVDEAHNATRAHQRLASAIAEVTPEVNKQRYALEAAEFSGVAAATAISEAKRKMTTVIEGASVAIEKELDLFRKLDDAVEKFRDNQLRGIEESMGGRNMDATLDKAAKKNEDTARKVESVWDRAGRQISTITTDLGRSLTDLMTKGGKLKNVMADTFGEIGKSLLRSAIEAQVRRVTSAVVDLISKSGVLGKVLGSIFGGGASAAAGGIGQAAGGAAGAAGSIGGGAASAGSAAASGIMGTIGAIGSIGSMVSGIINNFQSAGMNKSLDVIVQHTLQTTNIVRDTLLKANEFWPYLKSNNDAIWATRDTLLDPVTSTMERILTSIRTMKIEGGMPVVINLDGKVLAQAIVRELKLAGA